MAEQQHLPLVKLAGLYENESTKGNKYFVGYLGGAKVLLLKDSKAVEGQPGWNLFVQERPQKTESQGGGRAAPPLGGQGRNAPIPAQGGQGEEAPWPEYPPY